MSEKPSNPNRLIEKMRTNAEKQNRKTGTLPKKRTRVMAQKVRHGAEKKE